MYRCTINLRPGGVAMVNSEAHAKDAHGALDQAIEKLRAQLSRLKREHRDDKQARGQSQMPARRPFDRTPRRFEHA